MHFKQLHKNRDLVYTFGFKYGGHINIIRLIISSHMCSI
jgi:hypothetical protein